MAKEALEGHCIYDGGFCKLHLAYSRHTDLNVKINNDRGRDYTGRNITVSNNQPSILGPQPVPILSAAPMSYNGVPYQPTANGLMVTPRQTMGWNTGAPLPLSNGQIYMHQPLMAPPGVAPGMVQLPGPPMPPQPPYIH